MSETVAVSLRGVMATLTIADSEVLPEKYVRVVVKIAGGGRTTQHPAFEADVSVEEDQRLPVEPAA